MTLLSPLALAIIEWLDEQYEPVSVAQIAAGLDASKSAVQSNLGLLLEDDRVIRVHDGQAKDPALWVSS